MLKHLSDFATNITGISLEELDKAVALVSTEESHRQAVLLNILANMVALTAMALAQRIANTTPEDISRIITDTANNQIERLKR